MIFIFTHTSRNLFKLNNIKEKKDIFYKELHLTRFETIKTIGQKHNQAKHLKEKENSILWKWKKTNEMKFRLFQIFFYLIKVLFWNKSLLA